MSFSGSPVAGKDSIPEITLNRTKGAFDKSIMILKRTIIAVLATALCGWGIWQAARVGFARTLEEYAVRQRRDNAAEAVRKIARVSNSQEAADRAVALLPADAESHSARAEVLQFFGDYPQARAEFARSVQLRPRDYYLWMMLGINRDLSQDQEGALRALRQAALLAPSYAQGHWQLGNLLLRMGQPDQAFIELRRAAMSNPTFWPNVIDFAWGVYGHDPGAVIRALQPETNSARMALALFFARNNQSAAAVEQFRQFQSLHSPSTASAQNLLDELLKARAYSEAYEVWARMQGLPLTNASEIRDGSFEEKLTVGQTGFDWQVIPNVPNVTMSVDEAEHQSGSRSLRIDFRGNSNPTTPLITQIVLVKPRTRYHLGVAVLSKEFLSAANPVITLIDASDPKGTVLAQSPPLLSDPKTWRELAIDFTTNAGTQAITITIARETCTSDPCAAFGTVWVDSVLLRTVAAIPALK